MVAAMAPHSVLVHPELGADGFDARACDARHFNAMPIGMRTDRATRTILRFWGGRHKKPGSTRKPAGADGLMANRNIRDNSSRSTIYYRDHACDLCGRPRFATARCSDWHFG